MTQSEKEVKKQVTGTVIWGRFPKFLVVKEPGDWDYEAEYWARQRNFQETFYLKKLLADQPKYVDNLLNYAKVIGRELTEEEIEQATKIYQDLCEDLGITLERNSNEI